MRIAGNREQLQASELINYHRVEGGVAACMRAAGKAYRIRPFVSAYDGFTDADLGFGSGRGSVADSITDLGRRSILNEIAAARAARAGVLDSGAVVRPADVGTLNRCTAPYQHRPRISYREAPLPGRAPAAAWTRGVEQIHAAFAADVDCRLPAYRIAMRLLAPRLGPWQRQHRAEIDAVHAVWQQRVALARHLPRKIT